LVRDLAAISSARSTLTAGTHEMVALVQAGDMEAATTMLEATAPGYNEWVLQLTAAVKYEQQQASILKSRADRAGDLAFWLLVIWHHPAAFRWPRHSSPAPSSSRCHHGVDCGARPPATWTLCEACGTGALSETLDSMIATVQQRTDGSIGQRGDAGTTDNCWRRAHSRHDALTRLGNHVPPGS
jgi:hypothetical protein